VENRVVTDSPVMFGNWFKPKVRSPKTDRCGMYGRSLGQQSDPLSGDCGGDCWGCVGEVESDMGCDPSVQSVRREIREGWRDGKGKARSPSALASLEAIKQLLRDDWDPIALMPHLPADEYDSYAIQVFSMLSASASVSEVADYLSDAEMTGTPDRERDLRVAQKAAMIMSGLELSQT